MLNDIKDWAVETKDSVEVSAHGYVEEVATKDVMEWSAGLWLAIAVALVLVLSGLRRG